jgi:hypothetical protein
MFGIHQSLHLGFILFSWAHYRRISTTTSEPRIDCAAPRRTPNVVPRPRRLQKGCRGIPRSHWHPVERSLKPNVIGPAPGGWSGTLT